MSGSESELINFIEVATTCLGVYIAGYFAGKSRGFVEAIKMAVIDGKAKVVVESKDRKAETATQDPAPATPDVCPYCGGKTRALTSHKGHRVFVCNKCGPINLVKQGGAE